MHGMVFGQTDGGFRWLGRCQLSNERIAGIWWCHDMEMLTTILALCEGNPMLSALPALCEGDSYAFCITGPLWGESTSDRWIPLKSPVMWYFDVFSLVSLNKLLNRQLRCCMQSCNCTITIWPSLSKQSQNTPHSSPIEFGVLVYFVKTILILIIIYRCKSTFLHCCSLAGFNW